MRERGVRKLFEETFSLLPQGCCPQLLPDGFSLSNGEHRHKNPSEDRLDLVRRELSLPARARERRRAARYRDQTQRPRQGEGNPEDGLSRNRPRGSHGRVREGLRHGNQCRGGGLRRAGASPGLIFPLSPLLCPIDDCPFWPRSLHFRCLRLAGHLAQ